MMSTSSVAEIASLIGDPARANMLFALLDGRALTAAELARTAGITPQTASGHLSRLTGVNLLAVERQGRHRYHRLASPEVARMLEGVMALAAGLDAPDAASRKPRLAVGPRDQQMRRLRTCYDHLAGQVAVAMVDRMRERGHLDLSPDGAALTDDGAAFLRDLGVDLDAARPSSRRGRLFCRPCLDWSERRPHIAGAVGAALCQTCLTRGWLRRVDGSRAVVVTPPGRRILGEAFDLRAEL